MKAKERTYNETIENSYIKEYNHNDIPILKTLHLLKLYYKDNITNDLLE